MKFRFQTLLSLAALLVSGSNALSHSEKVTLLRLHQKTRNEMGASNMKSISWSNQLANSAQRYANECNFMSHCVHVHKHCDEIHENLAGNSGTDDVAIMYKQWEKEKNAFLRSGVVDYFRGGHAWGHFSQIVWADNTEIGCGMAKCRHRKMGGKYNLLVCKYRRGNVLGAKVFEGGRRR